MDDELEKLRKKRMQDLQQQPISEEDLQRQQDEQQQEYEKQKQAIIRTILTPEARERLGRVKVARPDIVDNIERQLIMVAQSGQLKTKITDEQLRGLLAKVIPKKRDINIRRR